MSRQKNKYLTPLFSFPIHSANINYYIYNSQLVSVGLFLVEYAENFKYFQVRYKQY